VIEWKGLFANTPYSSANNKTQDDAVVGMQDTIYVTGPGYGGYSANVRVHNASGAVVALIPVSGGGGALSAPAPVRILDDSTTYSYSLEVVRGAVPSDDADKIVIRIVGGASKRYPGQGSTLPDGSTSFARPVQAPGFVPKPSGIVSYVRQPSILNQTTWPLYTWGAKFELPVRTVRAIRFAVVPSPTGPTTFIGSAGCRATWDSTWTPDGETSRAAWGGSATKLVPQSGTPDRIWSDWLMLPAVPRTDVVGAGAIVMVRLYVPETNCSGCGGSGDEATWGSNPLRYRAAFASGDFVTNPAGFGGGDPAWTPIVALEYASDDDAVTVLEVGDSIRLGEKATPKFYGPLHQATDRINTKVDRIARISPMEFGVSGRSSLLYYPDFLKAVNEFTPPQIAVFCPYTRNNGTAITDQSGLAISFVAECRRRGIVPVLCTGIYEAANTANNALMQATNASVRSIAAHYGVDLIDLEPIINAGNAATLLNADKIHPNQTGTVALSNEYERVLELIAAQLARIGGA